MVARYTRGFIYYVSLTGVTGARRVLPEDIKENVKRIKLMTPLPVCVGFGISKPQHAKMLGEFADGIIVGSAIMKIILEEKSNKSALKKIGSFVSGLKKAM
jgi:tryptophan synthase alpha chain